MTIEYDLLSADASINHFHPDRFFQEDVNAIRMELSMGQNVYKMIYHMTSRLGVKALHA